MTTPYTLPVPHITEWTKRGWVNSFYANDPPHDAVITIPLFTKGQMQAAFAAGAASRDSEIEALRADAESWRKYKARKDAVITAGMGRNPLRVDAAIAAQGGAE